MICPLNALSHIGITIIQVKRCTMSTATASPLFFTLGLSLQLAVLCWRIEGSVCSWPPPAHADSAADGDIIRPSPEITERLKQFHSTPNAQARYLESS